MEPAEKEHNIFSSFSWEIIRSEKGTYKEDIICCWAHTEDNDSVLVRIHDCPESFYAVLPTIRGSSWDDDLCYEFHECMRKALGADRDCLLEYEYERENVNDQEEQKIGIIPDTTFCRKSMLYYHKRNRKCSEMKYPMCLFKFTNANAANHAKNILSSKAERGGVFFKGERYKCEVLEYEIDITRKLWTERGIECCGWFTCKPRRIKSGKMSTQKYEYITKYKSIRPYQSNKIPRPLWCSFDGEMYSHNHKAFPREWNTEDEINLISLAFFRDGDNDPSLWTEYCIMLGDAIIEDEEVLKRVIIIKVDTEEELLDTFCSTIVKMDPDFLTGYNIYGFDIRYFEARYKRLGRGWPLLGRLKKRVGLTTNIKWSSSAYKSKNMFIPYTPGRNVLDLFEHTTRSFNWSEYNLKNAAEVLLKNDPTKHKKKLDPQTQFEYYAAMKEYMEKKKEIEEALAKKKEKSSSGKSKSSSDSGKIKLDDKPLKDMGEFVVYNVYDSRVVVYIANEINWWVGLREMANACGTVPQKLLTGGQQGRVLSLIYHYAHQVGIIINKREKYNFFYEGGLVQKPVAGVSDKVVTLDFKSLYPSIIIAYNLSHDTLINPKDYHLYKENEYNRWVIPISEEKIEEDEDDIDEEVKIVKGDMKDLELRFVKPEVRKGVLPSLLASLLKSRSDVRKIKTEDPIMKKVYDCRQLALKIVANSCYGFTGVKNGGKGPCIEIAALVCFLGRKSIMESIHLIERNYGWILKYGDTDSCMMEAVDVPYDKVYEKSNEVAAAASAIHPQPLELEVENVCKILCIKQKHYAKYTYWNPKDPKFPKDAVPGDLMMAGDRPYMTIKGLTPVRRDNCQWVRNIMTEILFRLMNGFGYYSCVEYLTDSVVSLFNGEVPIDDLVISKAMGASYKLDSATMKVFAEKMSARGMNILPGERHKFIVCEGEQGTKVGEKMMLLSLYEMTRRSKRPKIDYGYYYNNLLMKKVDVLIGAEFSKCDQLDRVSFRRGRVIATGKNPAKMLSMVIDMNASIEEFLKGVKKVSGDLGVSYI